MSAALKPDPTELTLATRLFGVITIPSSLLVHFADGLPGFAAARHFALLPAATPPLDWLQSIDDPALVFLLAKWHAVAEPLEGAGGEAYAIVTLPSAGESATANLQAPVLIDPVTREAAQLIRSDAIPGTAVPIDLPALLRA